MKKITRQLTALIAATMMLSNAVLHCKTRLTVRNNTDSEIEIAFGFGRVYFTLKPQQELECKVGDTFDVTTPWGVAGVGYDYHLDRIESTTLEINEGLTYFLGEDEMYYWNEGR